MTFFYWVYWVARLSMFVVALLFAAALGASVASVPETIPGVLSALFLYLSIREYRTIAKEGPPNERA